MAKLMGKPSGVAARVQELVLPVVEEMGLRLWDVRFEKEGAMWYLKILIDRDEPLDMKTCEAATRAIDPILDEADPISQSYCLEVGSPGLGRKLTREEHFELMRGQKVRAGFYKANEEGEKDVAGLLCGFCEGSVQLNVDGLEVSVPLEEISFVKSCDDEGLFG